jgi:hypothetical protein
VLAPAKPSGAPSYIVDVAVSMAAGVGVRLLAMTTSQAIGVPADGLHESR